MRNPRTRLSADAIPGKRQPVSKQPELDAGKEMPVFNFQHADTTYTGDFGFHKDEASSHDVLRLILDVSNKTWNEICTEIIKGRKKHHSQGIDTLEAPAQHRIIQRKLDEIFGSEIFRFRDGKKRRLWGFRDREKFYVLWWDPDHKVYEVDKD